MRIAYGYNRDPKALAKLGCDRVYSDNDKTKRLDRGYMIDKAGIKSGDVVVVIALGDLGRGKEATKIANMITAQGGSVEVEPDEIPRKRGRPQKRVLSPEADARLKAHWLHGADPNSVFDAAKDELGEVPPRSWFSRRYGNRDGSTPKGLKRKAVV